MHQRGTELDDEVSFLSRPSAYRDGAGEVCAIETHMSWVFLIDAFAYKLKKPARFDGLDFSSAELRRRNCEEELRLNRRLAPDVYLGVVSLTREPDGRLALDGAGPPVDWLVYMRRLPADRMLDAIVTSGRAAAEEATIRAVARYLAAFYKTARREPMTAVAHRARLRAGVQRDLQELSQPRFHLPRGPLEALAHDALRFLEQSADVFDWRVDAGCLVEGHGDLRPEHICVGREPAIIDCLEFDRDLRVLDPADELAFLGLECERLDAPWVGQWFLDAYIEVTGDVPPPPLLDFYRSYRALRRARIAANHLDDPHVRDPERFAARARQYLERAADTSGACQQVDH